MSDATILAASFRGEPGAVGKVGELGNIMSNVAVTDQAKVLNGNATRDCRGKQFLRWLLMVPSSWNSCPV